MNQRIFELAKQADLIQWDTLPSGDRTPDHESVAKARKLAELIVQECARIITNGGYWTDILGNRKNASPDEIAQMIKEHFGVDE